MTQPLLNRLRILLVLWVLLASLYTITYSGLIESGDTRRMLDAVGSLVDYGDQYLDLTAWQFPPNFLHFDGKLPLESVNVEPLQIVSAAPLYWLAKHIPNIGLVHTTYLFNVIVGATIGSVIFLYALTLGYDERTAALATIVFGIGTAVVPYSKSFFREPLMMLCLVLAAFFLERLRQLKTSPLLIGAALALLALALTKASGLLALPALVVIALPSTRNINRRTLIVGAVIVLLLAALFVALGTFDLIPGLSNRYNVLRFLNGVSGQYFGVALHSYLLSPGGSVWGTSPVLLLTLPGVFLLLRRRQYRYPLAILLLVLGFAVGYALLNGAHWFGGLSWPPRFLVPVLALAFVGAFPALDWLAHHPRSLWIVPAILLVIYAVWVQISAVSLWWGEYPQYLPPEAGSFLEWGGGHNVIQYLRWVVIPQLWSFRPLDNAWAVTDTPLIPILLGVLVVLCCVWLWRNVTPSPDRTDAVSSDKVNDRRDTITRFNKIRRRFSNLTPASLRSSPPLHCVERGLGGEVYTYSQTPSLIAKLHYRVRRNSEERTGYILSLQSRFLWRGVRFPLLLLLLYLLITWAGLRILYERDERYDAQNQSLHAMLSIIGTETTADDVILLSTPGYEAFFLNYYTSGGRVITLPLQPGEQTSPEQPPEVRSEFPDALLTLQTIPLLHTLANTHERLWLLVEFGPDLGWSTRPVERFLTMHYYPVEYWQTAPQVRLVEYNTADAPDAFAFRSPERQTDLVFGETIQLAGFDLPDGLDYAPGDALPVSLYWITDAPLEANYSIGLFLRAADDSPVSQSDWQPDGYFAPTSTWQVGVPVWDNRALCLPADLPSGDYQLWVKIYDNPPGGSPQDLTVTGAETLYNTIGVLPVRITVRNS